MKKPVFLLFLACLCATSPTYGMKKFFKKVFGDGSCCNPNDIISIKCRPMTPPIPTEEPSPEPAPKKEPPTITEKFNFFCTDASCEGDTLCLTIAPRAIKNERNFRLLCDFLRENVVKLFGFRPPEHDKVVQQIQLIFADCELTFPYIKEETIYLKIKMQNQMVMKKVIDLLPYSIFNDLSWFETKAILWYERTKQIDIQTNLISGTIYTPNGSKSSTSISSWRSSSTNTLGSPREDAD